MGGCEERQDRETQQWIRTWRTALLPSPGSAPTPRPVPRRPLARRHADPLSRLHALFLPQRRSSSMFLLRSATSALVLLSVLRASAALSPRGAVLAKLTHLAGTVTPNIFQSFNLLFCHQDILLSLFLSQVFNPWDRIVLARFRCPTRGQKPRSKKSGQDR